MNFSSLSNVNNISVICAEKSIRYTRYVFCKADMDGSGKEFRFERVVCF